MFTYPLSDKDKYWVGYFRADGSIRQKDYLSYFAQSYFHPVNEFAEYIGRPGQVSSRGRVSNFGFHTEHKVTSAKAGRLLYSLGAKSTLNRDLYLSGHFWRGIIDGDGSLGVYHDGRQAAVGLIATSEDIEAFLAFLDKWRCRYGAHVYTRKSMMLVNLRGNQAKYLVELLYSTGYTANLRKQMVARKIMDLPWKTHPRSWQPPAPRDEAEYSLAA